jgi:hypothetical protein
MADEQKQTEPTPEVKKESLTAKLTNTIVNTKLEQGARVALAFYKQVQNAKTLDDYKYPGFRDMAEALGFK